ncbi:unnamed protein product [Ilex paraguariensis]|uniref:BAG family molecular chaperone regulator 8, chloroplastic n=1 Tax=Ilex paraguariensis TaxID=185542 RepID=A0ABC8UYA5_9AQUA
MASPHHGHCQHQISRPTTATATNPSCCYYCCTTLHHPPPPDPLLQSLSSHLHHSSPQSHLYSPYINPPYNPHQHYQPNYYPPQPHQRNQQNFEYHHKQQHEQEPEQTHPHPIVSSLLRRVSALETSVRHHSVAASCSLRDAAARTIQTHFRAFLVRRSRTLRQLKGLAFIKATLNILKSSVSDNTHFDFQALSRKAMDLLLKLDSFQGSDPMIRNGKKKIRRELIRFVELIDGVSVKRNELSSRLVKDARWLGSDNKSRVLYGDYRGGAVDCKDLGRDKRVLLEKIRGQVEKIHGFSRVSEEEDEKDMELENPSIFRHRNCGVLQHSRGGLVNRHDGVEAKVKKSVSFAENGNVYKVYRSSNEPDSLEDCNSSDGSDSIDAERELVNNLGREIEELRVSSKETEDDEETHTEDRESSQISDGERDPEKDLKTGGKYEPRSYRDEDGGFVFSAPLPVKMETRAGLVNKRKTITIIK